MIGIFEILFLFKYIFDFLKKIMNMLYKMKFERVEWVNSIGIISDNENVLLIVFLKDY